MTYKEKYRFILSVVGYFILLVKSSDWILRFILYFHDYFKGELDILLVFLIAVGFCCITICKFIKLFNEGD